MEQKATELTERSVREEELDEFLGLMCRSFQLDFASARPIFYSDPYYDVSLKRVMIDDATQRILSGLTIVPAGLRLPGGAQIPVGGIAGVCTQPELQRRGYGRALLRSTLATLPSLGFPLAALTAESPALYRHAGFEFCSTPVFWQAASHRLLPSSLEGLDVRVLSPEQWQREADGVRRLYERALGAEPGTFQRDARRWANIEWSGGRRSIAVWKNRSHLEAYLIFQETRERDTVQLTIAEMVAESDAGCRALIGFLARRPSEYSLRGQLRSSDFVRFGLNTITGIETRVEPGMLVRVTDLEKVLTIAAEDARWISLLQDSGGLTLRIEQSRLTWTQKSLRLFTVTDRDGRSCPALAPADELIGHWISLDDHALAQLVTGFKSVRQLSSEERLRASGEDALALAEQLFPVSEPFLGLLDAF